LGFLLSGVHVAVDYPLHEMPMPAPPLPLWHYTFPHLESCTRSGLPQNRPCFPHDGKPHQPARWIAYLPGRETRC
jgi:hypothetical protein